MIQPGDNPRSVTMKYGRVGPSLIPYTESVPKTSTSVGLGSDISIAVKQLGFYIEHYRQAYAEVAQKDPDGSRLVFDSVAHELGYEGTNTQVAHIETLRTRILELGVEKGWNLEVSEITQESERKYPLGFGKPTETIWQTFMIATVIKNEATMVSEIS